MYRLDTYNEHERMAKAGSHSSRSRKSTPNAAVNGAADVAVPASTVTRSDTESFPLQYVKGIGPARAAALAELGIRTVRDLFLMAPRAYLDRRTVLPLRTTKL